MNSYRNTSLHYAVQGRDVTVIQALLSAKADVQATNEYVLSVQLQAAPVDFRLPMRSPLFLQHLIIAHFILQKWGHAAAFRRQTPCHHHIDLRGFTPSFANTLVDTQGAQIILYTFILIAKCDNVLATLFYWQ